MDAAWEIPAGRLGIETLLLLVREEGPLPGKDEEMIAKLLANAHASPQILIKEAVWLEKTELTWGPGGRRNRLEWVRLETEKGSGNDITL